LQRTAISPFHAVSEFSLSRCCFGNEHPELHPVPTIFGPYVTHWPFKDAFHAVQQIVAATNDFHASRPAFSAAVGRVFRRALDADWDLVVDTLLKTVSPKTKERRTMVEAIRLADSA
jgi:hypothetical protein